MSVAAGELLLPVADGSLERYVPGEPAVFERPAGPPASRVFYAAAHVVADPAGQRRLGRLRARLGGHARLPAPSVVLGAGGGGGHGHRAARHGARLG